MFSAQLKPVTILILIDGFLQLCNQQKIKCSQWVTILILIDGFLQYNLKNKKLINNTVTILILIDGFLQFRITAWNTNPWMESQSLF